MSNEKKAREIAKEKSKYIKLAIEKLVIEKLKKKGNNKCTIK